MSQEVIVIEADEASLAAQIAHEHDMCVGAHGSFLEHAAACGRLLMQAKARCGHGRWERWVNDNCVFAIRTASGYMRIANCWEELYANRQSSAVLSIDGALELLAKPRDSHQLINASTSNEWYTPTIYIEAVRQVLGTIDIDPASCEMANKIIGAKKYYTIETDGFNKAWKGRVFLNPPYGKDDGDGISNQNRWSKRLIEQYESGITTEAILLVNSVTGEKWFSHLWDYIICFTDHRIRFYSPDVEAGQPTHSNVFVYLGNDAMKFARVFQQFGVIAKRLEIK